MPPHPRLRIRPATAADSRACQEIRYCAFRPGPMSRLMWPGEFSEADAEELTRKFEEAMTPEAVAKSKATTLVAELLPDVDATEQVASHGGPEQAMPAAGTDAIEAAGVAAATHVAEGSQKFAKREFPLPQSKLLRNPETGGTIIAFAKWHLYREERPEAEWAEKRRATTQVYGSGANLELCDAFLGGLRELRQQYIAGRPHFLLSLLACAPNYQRLGAGAALVRWGTNLADQEGYVSWLEASPPGYHLYAREGFCDVTVLDLDVTGRWGLVRTDTENWGIENAIPTAGKVPGEGWFRTVLMKREPKA